MKPKRFIGTFIDTPDLGEVRVLHDYVLDVNEEGFISSFGPHPHPHATSSDNPNIDEIETTYIPTGSFLLPSFYDLHLHAPQFLYQGTGLHLPLMEWLDQYAFKAEERIDSDLDLARGTYEALAARLKEHGTGTVLLFGTIKEDTNLLLADIMQKAGIRAFVGKLSMDISTRPTYVESSTLSSLTSARSFVQRLRSSIEHLPQSERLIEPVLTPRFVPTCSDELLAGLGEMVKELDVRVQSHLAEARDEVDWVFKERGVSDVDVFEKNNLLTPKTIQAHCTFLPPSSLTHLSNLKTSIAHCPLSNSYFSSKPFPLREALKAGVKVGLGTDVAGGYSVDLMCAMRWAVSVSRIREGWRRESMGMGMGMGMGTEVVGIGESRGEDEDLSINWKESLYLATKGGATALNLPQGTGSFTPNSPFDAQLIHLYHKSPTPTPTSTPTPTPLKGIGPLDFFDLPPINPGQEQPTIVTQEMLEKWWCIGDVRNRGGVWVQGRQCFPYPWYS